MNRLIQLRAVLVLSMVATALAFAVPAAADDTDGVVDDHQHGAVGGHLPASSLNVELVGKVRVRDAAPGIVADVGTFRNYAYLAQFRAGCDADGRGGVYVIDISNVAAPREVGFIESPFGSFPGEGIHAIHVDTDSFEGDVLATNQEICRDGGKGGFSLYDVSNPLAPATLVESFGDTNGGAVPVRQYHSVFIWQQEGKAYLVASDDDERGATDVDIFDISDPRHPVQIADTGLASWPSAFVNGWGATSFNHDMVVEKLGDTWTMLNSYWDAGYVKLNVNDPANPVFIDDSDFSSPDPEFPEFAVGEGNAHYAEFDRKGRFIIATDEDFSPDRTLLEILSGANRGQFAATEGSASRPIRTLPDALMNDGTTYLGLGCSLAGLPPATEDGNPNTEELAVIQRGVCTFQVKADNAQALGYDGFIVFNDAARGDALVTMAVTSTLPGIFVGHSTGQKLFGGAVPAVGTVGEQAQALGRFDGWGYIHLFDADTLRELDTYAVPATKDPANASGSGAMSIHEVTFSRNSSLAYLSWYDAGFRVVSYGPGGLQEVGHFIDDGGNDFWGVQVRTPPAGPEVVLASDRDSGLYIFRYTGPQP